MSSRTSEYSITKNSIISTTEEQVSAELAGEAVILDLKSGMYYGVNPVGARIWELIQEPLSVSKIQQTILEEYDVEAERCERDVLNLLQDFAAKGLIEIKDEA